MSVFVPELAIILSGIITHQEQVLVIVGKLNRGGYWLQACWHHHILTQRQAQRHTQRQTQKHRHTEILAISCWWCEITITEIDTSDIYKWCVPTLKLITAIFEDHDLLKELVRRGQECQLWTSTMAFPMSRSYKGLGCARSPCISTTIVCQILSQIWCWVSKFKSVFTSALSSEWQVQRRHVNKRGICSPQNKLTGGELTYVY